jgi:Holliday junction DNA helicase RuvA
VIARLTGQLIEKQPPILVVDVNGVGYELEAPMSTFYKVTLGAPVTLYVHQVVREDANLLYGFASREERDMCRTLLKVNGVGPKMALAILSGMEADAFAACIRQDDVATPHPHPRGRQENGRTTGD